MGGASLGNMLGSEMASNTQNPYLKVLALLGGTGAGGAAGWLGSGALLGEPSTTDESDERNIDRIIDKTQKKQDAAADLAAIK